MMKSAKTHNSSDAELISTHLNNKTDAILISNSTGLEKVASTPNDQQQQIRNSSLKSTNIDGSELFIKRCSSVPRPLLPPNFPGNNNFLRRSSLLEQKLLPGLRCGDEVHPTLSKDKRLTTKQLTIFYDGIINVYNNIPVDKAQAIMRVASESSSSKPVVAERLKTDVRTPPSRPKLLSASKLRAGIPMARQYSLQCFLEKRRGRIVNKPPYALIRCKKHEDSEATIDNGSNESHIVSLSPFPSRLGYLSPINDRY